MKDLRLFCYGEQTYGSGSKGSEQCVKQMIGQFFYTIIGASTDRVVGNNTSKSSYFGFYAVRCLPVLLFISWCFVWNNWATHWGRKIEIANDKLRG